MAGETTDIEHETGPDESEQIPAEVLERRDRALKLIRKFGEPVLRSEAREVDEFGDDLEREVVRMVQIMRDSLGIGLAAPQVGLLRRLFVYQVGDDQRPIALINPEVEWISEDQEIMQEGCLSLPGVHVDVERPVHVRVAARDASGEKQLVEASGLEARVILHEIDHLDGVLILDRASKEARREAMRELREAEGRSGLAA